ncbi:hypothetical protein SK128_007586 [Halocaridina rubra]|uniref:Nuclear nucleic acid-binding protein C1D n=1 Tax=Halocaridina rubra TaxID=373956 RepID=A0AAN8XTS2_HALRR
MEERMEAATSPGENGTNSQAEFPPGMAPKMLKIVKILSELENKLQPLISKPYHEVLTKMPPMERAKMGMMELYTVNTLFWSLMRTSGEEVDTTLKDDYKIEMGRLKETQSRLAELEARSRRQRMDLEAASRFIHHGLGIRRTDGENGEGSHRVVPNEMARLQRLKERLSFPSSGSRRNEDMQFQNQEYPNQEEELHLLSADTYKKKRKKTVEHDSVDSGVDVLEVLDRSSGYHESGEESFVTVPKKLKEDKKVEKRNAVKASDAQKGRTTSVKKKVTKKSLKKKLNSLRAVVSDVLQGTKPLKKKKKKLVNGAKLQRSGAAEDAVPSIGHENTEPPSPTIPKQQKKKKNVNKPATENAVYLDSVGSGLKVEEKDLNMRSREWYEQGWT